MSSLEEMARTKQTARMSTGVKTIQLERTQRDGAPPIAINDPSITGQQNQAITVEDDTLTARMSKYLSPAYQAEKKSKELTDNSKGKVYTLFCIISVLVSYCYLISLYQVR